MNDTTLKLRNENLEWRQIDDEVVALDVRHAEYLGMEGSAAALWCALEPGASRAELTDLLVERYGIDAQRACTDVDAFIDDLTARELLG